eukprot:1919560-Pyramimonas_sp.AAC.1
MTSLPISRKTRVTLSTSGLAFAKSFGDYDVPSRSLQLSGEPSGATRCTPLMLPHLALGPLSGVSVLAMLA